MTINTIHRLRYIIAYDVANPKRLRRVARILEKHALRLQKSVFQFYGTQNEFLMVINELRPVIDHEEDLIQAWNVKNENRLVQALLGKQPDHMPMAIVLSATRTSFISQDTNAILQ